MASIAEKLVTNVAAVSAQYEAIKIGRPILLDEDGGFLAEIMDDGSLRLNDARIGMKDAMRLGQFISDNYEDKL